MSNVRSIFYCILAVIFTASIISACKDGEDGTDGADGRDGTPGSVITIGNNCNWFIDGVDTGKPACAVPGSVVSIGANGNWFIDGVDTGISARGPQGEAGVPPQITIGANGNWFIDGVDTGVKAQGPTPQITIGANGNWFVDGVDTGVQARGPAGSVITIGANGNWFIDGNDTGVSARGSVITIGTNGNWFIDGEDTGYKAVEQPNIPPVADFSWAPEEMGKDEPVQFTDLSTDEDGEIVKWEWNFGGTVITVQNPVFTFASNGLFEVSLTVTDNRDATHTKTVTILVGIAVDFEADRLEVVNSEITNILTETGMLPALKRNVITFTDQTIEAPTAWEWTFISGSTTLTSTDQNPQITFTEAGIYSVTLVASNSKYTGTITKEDYITIFEEGALNKSLFQEWAPTGLPSTAVTGGGVVANLWDGVWATEITGSYPTASVPATISIFASANWHFTFDMGQTARLSRFKLHNRHNMATNTFICYGGGHPKRFQIWGADTADGVTSDFSTWILLGEFLSIRPEDSQEPSGPSLPGNTPPTTYRLALAAELQYACVDGEDYFFDFEKLPKVRYIRFQGITSWGNTGAFPEIGSVQPQLTQITFWGIQ